MTTVGELVKVLSNINPDLPITCMGSDFIVAEITATDRDHVVLEEDERALAQAYCVEDPHSLGYITKL